MKTLAIVSAALVAVAVPVAAHASTYPGPTTTRCIAGDAYVGPASDPIMCWPTNNCPYLPVGTQGCPVATATPTPTPAPRVTIFPGEHGPGGAVVHVAPTPAPQALAAHPDQYVYFDGSYWSF